MEETTDGEDWRPLLTQAEAVLSRSFGGEIRLEAPERITDEHRRNLLLRCRVASGPEDAPTSLMLKQAHRERYDPENPESGAAQGLFRDWAGLQFLNEAEDDSTGCPRFFGGDRANGFVAMEDLGPVRDLAAELLQGSAERAGDGLILLAGVLGRMHAATLGREDDYLRIRNALSPWKDRERFDRAREIREKVREKIGEVAQRLETPLGDPFWADLEAIALSVEDPGPFLAYTHGDPCPDNMLLRGNDDLRLFDYEIGGYRHALQDGVYGRIRFPTCWCVGDIPEPVLDRMDSTYRTELAKNCPAAQDDALYEKAVAEMCGFWLLGNMAWMLPDALESDRDWGIATMRQRIVKRLEAFCEVSERTGRLVSIREVALRFHEKLRARWEGEMKPLPLYPAFRAGGAAEE